DEYLNNFELGVKTQFLDGRATVNLAGFFSQSRDFQFFFVDATTGSQIISNLEEVHIWGADLDLSFRPLRQLVLFGGFGLTDSNIQALGNDELESFLSASGVDTSGIEGNRSPRTTEFTLNTGAQVRFDLSSWLSLMFRATYELQGNKYWQIDNLDVRDPVHLIGLRASVGGESWSVAVWGRNLLDEAYYADFNPAEFAGTGFDLGFQARPLSFGLDLRGQF
ncbi:MAG: TonB-dependent receptor, partial [Myxococcota bacterium]